jgi:hypothetical protein
MHHIALCTSCIALVNCDHHFAYVLDHVEPQPEMRSKSKEYGGPQAISCEDANIIVIKACPGASKHRP